MWQTIIHMAFVLSALGIAAVERMGVSVEGHHH
jgi:uncharacterized membrane protein YqhA